jgi:hypothetical protein
MVLFSTLYILTINNNVISLFEGTHILGIVSSLLFLIIIPESPKFLFMNDPYSKKGIKVLNYISWFNGSTKRFADDVSLERSLITDQIHQPGRGRGSMITVEAKGNCKCCSFYSVWMDIRDLFSGCDLKIAICTLILNICNLHLYFICLFNASELEGNPIRLLMSFSFTEAIGIFVSAQIIKYISIPKMLALCMCMIIAMNSLIKFSDISALTTFALFMCQSFFIGACYNSLGIV